MSNPYWFKAKQYGYGAQPVTWQGWVLSLIPLLVVVPGIWWITTHRSAANLTAILAWVLLMVVVTAVIAVISARKTDSPWRWRWGREQ